MKNIFLSLLTIFAVVGTATAQDAPVNRSLSFYLDAASGNLTEQPGFEDGDKSRIFSGNEFEFGMSYSQNFATVPWLSIWVKALVVAVQNTGYDATSGDFLGNAGYSLAGYGLPRAQVGVNFGGFAVIAMDTRGLIAQENYYSVALPGNGGAFTFSTVLEFWAVPQILNPDNAPIDGDDKVVDGSFLGTGRGTTIVDLFALNVQYGINIAPNWSFWTKVAFRFSGGGGKDGAADTFFQDGFNLRWENNIHWNVTPKFYMYGRVRYNISGIATSIDFPGYVKPKADHAVTLHVGLGYTFDFSDN